MGTIYTNPYKNAKTQVWSPAQASIIVSKEDGNDPLFMGAVINLQITYERQSVTRYPISNGTDSTGPIRLVGVPNGQVQFDTIIGPTTQLENFLKIFGDSCEPFLIFIDANVNSCLNLIGELNFWNILDATGKSMTYTIQTNENGLSIAQGRFVMDFTNMTTGNAIQDVLG